MCLGINAAIFFWKIFGVLMMVVESFTQSVSPKSPIGVELDSNAVIHIIFILKPALLPCGWRYTIGVKHLGLYCSLGVRNTCTRPLLESMVKDDSFDHIMFPLLNRAVQMVFAQGNSRKCITRVHSHQMCAADHNFLPYLLMYIPTELCPSCSSSWLRENTQHVKIKRI